MNDIECSSLIQSENENDESGECKFASSPDVLFCQKHLARQMFRTFCCHQGPFEETQFFIFIYDSPFIVY